MDTVDNVRRLFSKYDRVYVQVGEGELKRALGILRENFRSDEVEVYRAPSFSRRIVFGEDVRDIAQVVAVLEDEGVKILSAGHYIPSLEEVMVELFGPGSD